MTKFKITYESENLGTLKWKGYRLYMRNLNGSIFSLFNPRWRKIAQCQSGDSNLDIHSVMKKLIK